VHDRGGDGEIAPRTQHERPVTGEDKPSTATAKISDYLNNTAPGDRRVVFGGHWSNNPCWLILTEEEQDITRPLSFPDDSVDFIFTEHVLEHVDIPGAISFMREALRILRPGGIMRIVCPVLDTMLAARLAGEKGKTYVANALVPYFRPEDESLRSIGLAGVSESPEIFLLNSLFRGHQHRFIWTFELLTRALKAVGFATANSVKIGEGERPECCIERRRRGIYMGYDWREELASTEVYDVESGAIEVRKAVIRSFADKDI
jgi:SAM-dependent methyltransferase